MIEESCGHLRLLPISHTHEKKVKKSNTLAVFASAYYKAWKSSSGGVKIQIENAIQEWIYWAVYLKPIKVLKRKLLLLWHGKLMSIHRRTGLTKFSNNGEIE